MAKIPLYTCVCRNKDYVGLHEIVSAWEQLGYVERKHIDQLPDGRFICWVGRIGGLGLEPSDVERISTPYEYVLSCQYLSKWKNMPRVLPWNFYPRSWSNYCKAQLEPPVHRTITSIFSGTVRPGHERSRWKNSTEVYSARGGGTYRRTNNLFREIIDYYRALAKSKFGLCPKGDVGVCQREIETMGLGCVPIFTPGVEYIYAHPVQKGVHFLLAQDPEDMHRQINSCSESTREEMSRAGRAYFDAHCSPRGLWKTVLETIEKFNIKIS